LSLLLCCTHKEYVIDKVTDSSRHDTLLNADFLDPSECLMFSIIISGIRLQIHWDGYMSV